MAWAEENGIDIGTGDEYDADDMAREQQEIEEDRRKQKMTEFLDTVGVYTGNEFKGEGIISKGVRQGQKWQRFKALFKPSMDSDKGFSFTCFGQLNAKNSKQLGDLIVGTSYKIIYTEEERTNTTVNPPSVYKSKTVVAFHSAEDPAGLPAPAPTPSQPMTAVNNPISNATGIVPLANIDFTNFEAFKTGYFNLIKTSGIKPSYIHMVGSYLASYEADRTTPLTIKCKEAINQYEANNGQNNPTPVV